MGVEFIADMCADFFTEMCADFFAYSQKNVFLSVRVNLPQAACCLRFNIFTKLLKGPVDKPDGASCSPEAALSDHSVKYVTLKVR